MYAYVPISLRLSHVTHLNKAVGDDISHIQSQRRGLQVQTQNQKVLLSELEKLLVRRFSVGVFLVLTPPYQQTVHVDRETLLTLTQESLEKTPSIQRLELAAAELYKALLAGRDNGAHTTLQESSHYLLHLRN